MTEQTARAEDAAATAGGLRRRPTQPAAPAVATRRALAAEIKDRLLRTLAEMENLRKRTEREVTDARLYGVASFARDMLGVADNMRRALDAVPPELRASAEAGVKALIDGVELTERELSKRWKRTASASSRRAARNSIPTCIRRCSKCPIRRCRPAASSQVVQPGYMIGERVLRPALVGVSKGGPESRAAVTRPPTTNRQRGRTDARCAASSRIDAVAHRAQPREHVGQVSARAMPTICRNPPAPKRSHCTTISRRRSAYPWLLPGSDSPAGRRCAAARTS